MDTTIAAERKRLWLFHKAENGGTCHVGDPSLCEGCGVKFREIDCPMIAAILADLDYAEQARGREAKVAAVVEAAKRAAQDSECDDICPYCHNDLRKRYDCKHCGNSHMDGECMRHGKHEDNCSGEALRAALAALEGK